MNRVPLFRENLSPYPEGPDQSLDVAGADIAVFGHVFAPVIFSYVLYVLNDAHERGIGKLVFLARDGYLFYKAALLLAPVIAPDIKLTYMSVSRFSLRSAEYFISGEKCMDTICTGGLGMTFRKMMKRASLEDEETDYIASKTEMSGRIDDVLDYRKICDLKERLRNVPEFFEIVKKHASGKWQILQDYLAQEGMKEGFGRGIAIVDSGWIGTVQKSLDRLITWPKDTGSELEGYYFGLYSLPAGTDSSRYHSYYISPDLSIKNIRRRSRFSICLFEAVCSAPEGLTTGYIHDGSGKIIPVTSEEGNPNKDAIVRYEEILLKDAGRLAEGTSLTESSACLSKLERMCEDLLSLCMSEPSCEEASCFGKMKFCDDVLENDMKDLAEKWDESDLSANRLMNKLRIKCGMKNGSLPESGWPEGSIVNACKGEASKAGRYLRSERRSKILTEVRKSGVKRGR